MGYFSNESEGEMWERENCEAGCVHLDDEAGCPVLNIHWQFNYDQFKKEEKPVKDILDELIPRGNGFNKKCAMYYKRRKKDGMSIKACCTCGELTKAEKERIDKIYAKDE